MEYRTKYLLHLADNALIMAQRNSEWTGHAPVLEQDIALTNIALDLLGQARMFYQEAALRIGTTDEDKLAYLRTEREYYNLLLVEQPNGDWAQTILRQYFFSQYQLFLFRQLQHDADEALAAIATKALKEIAYHLRWSSEWVVRLGDGTSESKQRMMQALDALWEFTGEMFVPVQYEEMTDSNEEHLRKHWLDAVADKLQEANLEMPKGVFMQTGGKEGMHTEHLGYLLAEMQYLQRAYPDSEW